MNEGSGIAEVVSQQLKGLLEAANYDGAKLLLQPVRPVDVAEAVGTLPRTLQALAFRLLPKDEAIEVYEYLEPAVQQSLLERLRSGEVLELVEQMSPDDRVRLFDELPAKVVRRLLAELSPAERLITAQMLGYATETAGRLMTTEFIDLKEFHTAAEALAIVRSRARDTETIYSLYVADASRHLSGMLSLRDLVMAEPEQRLGEVMTRDVVSVSTDTDQEEVARLIQRYDFLALPVVDREQRLVGIVTVDDVIDVIQQEATRDLYAAGAVQAGDEDDYFQSNLFTVARRRVVWLLVLLIANSGTAAVIAAMDGVLKQVVVLAAFIPLLIGTGGNVGAQSSTVVIRGLSTQRIQGLGPLRAIGREAIAGALLGLLMVL
ncbi:MAG: magnesium transporter, partial [Cyanobium sp.]